MVGEVDSLGGAAIAAAAVHLPLTAAVFGATGAAHFAGAGNHAIPRHNTCSSSIQLDIVTQHGQCTWSSLDYDFIPS